MIFFINVVKVEYCFFSCLADEQLFTRYRVHCLEKFHMLRRNRGDNGNIRLYIAHKCSHFARTVNAAFLNNNVGSVWGMNAGAGIRKDLQPG